MDPRCLTKRGNGSRSYSILIVDDDAGVRNLLADWVEVLGCRPHIADNAEAALDIARTQHIDVALIDIMMPGRDGVWLIGEIQRHCLHTAMIIVTGLTAMDPGVTLSPGVVGYILKPFRFDGVKATIEDAIRSREKLPHPHSIESFDDNFRPAAWGSRSTRSPLRLPS
jgi:DNA-binding NtrC family response regulator